MTVERLFLIGLAAFMLAAIATALILADGQSWPAALLVGGGSFFTLFMGGVGVVTALS
ncbi:hypothetical protein [Planobispora rosea]|uniref:hypothetical protein n=1 Tax=Planobispora rosea TaxID=35762 RepID=UPI00159F3134|nr:hypothetical protein [Planobispora rosea]